MSLPPLPLYSIVRFTRVYASLLVILRIVSTFTFCKGLNLWGYRLDNLVLVEAASDYAADMYPLFKSFGGGDKWLIPPVNFFIGESSEKKFVFGDSPAKSAAEIYWSKLGFLFYGGKTGFSMPCGFGILLCKESLWPCGLTPLGKDDLPLSTIGDNSVGLSDDVPLILGYFTCDSYYENSLYPSRDAPLPENWTWYYWFYPKGLGLGDPDVPRFLLLRDCTRKSF